MINIEREIHRDAEIEIYPSNAAKLEAKNIDRVWVLTQIAALEPKARVVYRSGLLRRVAEVHQG